MSDYEGGVKIVEKINRLKVTRVLPDYDLGFMFRSMMQPKVVSRPTTKRLFIMDEASRTYGE